MRASEAGEKSGARKSDTSSRRLRRLAITSEPANRLCDCRLEDCERL